MSSPRQPTPRCATQDDLDFLVYFATTILPALLRNDGTVDSAAVQTFKAGLKAVASQLDYLTSNLAVSFNRPTVTVGAAAGTGATATLLGGQVGGGYYNSSNLTGTIRVTTGTSPAANGTLATVHLGADVNGKVFDGNNYFLENDARVFLMPADKVTAQAMGPTQAVYVTPDATGTGWLLKSNDAALAAGTTYTWHYLMSA